MVGSSTEADWDNNLAEGWGTHHAFGAGTDWAQSNQLEAGYPDPTDTVMQPWDTRCNGFWSLNEDSGGNTAFDISGHLNDGAIDSGVSLDEPGIMGDTSMKFSDSEHITIPTDTSISTTNEFSFYCWIKGSQELDNQIGENSGPDPVIAGKGNSFSADDDTDTDFDWVLWLDNVSGVSGNLRYTFSWVDDSGTRNDALVGLTTKSFNTTQDWTLFGVNCIGSGAEIVVAEPGEFPSVAGSDTGGSGDINATTGDLYLTEGDFFSAPGGTHFPGYMCYAMYFSSALGVSTPNSDYTRIKQVLVENNEYWKEEEIF